MIARSFLFAGLCCAVATGALSQDLQEPPSVAMVVVTAGGALLGLSVSVGVGDTFDRQVVGRIGEDGFAMGTRVTSTPDNEDASCESDLSAGFESYVVCKPLPPVW